MRGLLGSAAKPLLDAASSCGWREFVMRRWLTLLVVALGLVALVGTGRLSAPVRAQDATPLAEMGLPPGVDAQPLGAGLSPTLPATPAELVLVRLTLQPGAILPNDPNDPSLALAYVESGTVTLHYTNALTITRAAAIAALATPEATMPGPEPVAAGASATLTVGDSFVSPANSGGDLRNEGTTPAVLLAAVINPFQMGTPEATPAA
jgi:hypothetical protein